MSTEDKFNQFMGRLVEAKERFDTINDSLEEIGCNMYLPVFEILVVDILKEYIEDDGDLIDYYLYELCNNKTVTCFEGTEEEKIFDLSDYHNIYPCLQCIRSKKSSK